MAREALWSRDLRKLMRGAPNDPSAAAFLHLNVPLVAIAADAAGNRAVVGGRDGR